jgi:hypothetical protein
MAEHANSCILLSRHVVAPPIVLHTFERHPALLGFLLEANAAKAFQRCGVRDVSLGDSCCAGICVDEDTGEMMCSEETGKRGSGGTATDD